MTATTVARTFGDMNVTNELLPEIFKLSIFGIGLDHGRRVDRDEGLFVRSVIEKDELELLDFLRILSGGFQRELLHSSGSLE